ncbi:MAG: polymerase subunit sigma-70 [Nocardioidaceae bacterium]|nr:polymerase subunit sigma-70 [Nocardioidaceae bacterium]
METSPRAGRSTSIADVDGHSPADPLWQRSERLFAAWRQGDADALNALVRILSPVLWHIVRAYGLDRDASDDVVQTTWLTLVRRSGSIRDERAVLRWLTTTARREAWRVSQRSRRTAASDDDALEAALPAQASAETTALLDDEQRLLWGQVARLSERCQRLLRVIAFSDRPDYAVLAADLDMPVGSIGPTRARCLDKLRALLSTPAGGTS